MKVLQKHSARCLSVFANYPVFVDDTTLALKVCESVARYFNDRVSRIYARRCGSGNMSSN